MNLCAIQMPRPGSLLAESVWGEPWSWRMNKQAAESHATWRTQTTVGAGMGPTRLNDSWSDGCP